MLERNTTHWEFVYTDVTTGLNYINQSVAECHGVQLPSLESWDKQVFSPVPEIASRPKELHDLSVVYDVPQRMVRSCNSYLFKCYGYCLELLLDRDNLHLLCRTLREKQLPEMDENSEHCLMEISDIKKPHRRQIYRIMMSLENNGKLKFKHQNTNALAWETFTCDQSVERDVGVCDVICAPGYIKGENNTCFQPSVLTAEFLLNDLDIASFNVITSSIKFAISSIENLEIDTDKIRRHEWTTMDDSHVYLEIYPLVLNLKSEYVMTFPSFELIQQSIYKKMPILLPDVFRFCYKYVPYFKFYLSEATISPLEYSESENDFCKEITKQELLAAHRGGKMMGVCRGRGRCVRNDGEGRAKTPRLDTVFILAMAVVHVTVYQRYVSK